jgi:type III secretion system YscD/HrpQ family protein
MNTTQSPPRATAVAPGWCLRFLSGAMKGRTIALKPGQNVVGSSGDADIMLPDGEVAARHLLFNAGEIVVAVQKLGNAGVQLNREEMQAPRRSLVAGDVVTIGRIELQLERSYPATEPPDAMFAVPASALPGDAEPAAVPALQRLGFRAGAALLGLACAGLLGLALWAGGDGRPARGGPAANLAEVEKALAPFSEVEAVAGPGGHVVVKGFVESRLRKQALQAALAPFGDRVAASVHAADELVEQARRYVGAAGVAVGYAGKGRLVLSGTADDEAVRVKVRRLGEDLYPAVLLSDKVEYRPPPPVDKDAALRAQWAAWQELLPARLVGITEGEDGMRSIQLANGSRYYEGSVLKSGAELRHIDAGGLVLGGGVPKPGGAK